MPGVAQTSSGMIIGTPLYISPEQCRGAGYVDHRADIYALGCLLFEMLVGHPPFQAQGAGELIAAHIAQAPPVVGDSRPEVPSWVGALVAALLAKDAGDRPQRMEDVVAFVDSEGQFPPLPVARKTQVVLANGVSLPVDPADPATQGPDPATQGPDPARVPSPMYNPRPAPPALHLYDQEYDQDTQDPAAGVDADRTAGADTAGVATPGSDRGPDMDEPETVGVVFPGGEKAQRPRTGERYRHRPATGPRGRESPRTAARTGAGFGCCRLGF